MKNGGKNKSVAFIILFSICSVIIIIIIIIIITIIKAGRKINMQ